MGWTWPLPRNSLNPQIADVLDIGATGLVLCAEPRACAWSLLDSHLAIHG